MSGFLLFLVSGDVGVEGGGAPLKKHGWRSTTSYITVVVVDVVVVVVVIDVVVVVVDVDAVFGVDRCYAFFCVRHSSDRTVGHAQPTASQEPKIIPPVVDSTN